MPLGRTTISVPLESHVRNPSHPLIFEAARERMRPTRSEGRYRLGPSHHDSEFAARNHPDAYGPAGEGIRADECRASALKGMTPAFDDQRGQSMKTVVLNLPTFGFVVATRAMLGAGVGLLLAERLSAEQRRAVAFTLIGVGLVTTVPALLAVFGGRKSAESIAA
jgi:hypothetical protein